MPENATKDRQKNETEAAGARNREASAEASFNRAGPPPPRSEQRKKHEERFRCLHCGYRLMSESEFRCSECGREHERYVLERWFWGKEENRFERVLWLVKACAFLKLWVFETGVVRAATAVSAAAAMWACWKAGEGKRDTVGWQYAVAGMAAAGLVLAGNAFGLFLETAAMVALDIAAACLLLIAMLRDSDRQELWREPTGSRMAMGILFAAPLLGVFFAMFDSHMNPNIFGTKGLLFGPLPNAFRFLIPRVTALAVWLFVWYWLAGLKRAMFVRPDA